VPFHSMETREGGAKGLLFRCRRAKVSFRMSNYIRTEVSRGKGRYILFLHVKAPLGGSRVKGMKVGIVVKAAVC
jgi:hypothetical protein